MSEQTDKPPKGILGLFSPRELTALGRIIKTINMSHPEKIAATRKRYKFVTDGEAKAFMLGVEKGRGLK
jgi:hypothetical protein